MNTKRLVKLILPHIDYAMVDQLNYPAQVSGLLRRHGWNYALTDAYAQQAGTQLIKLLGEKALKGQGQPLI